MKEKTNRIHTLKDLAASADYSLMHTLKRDPQAKENGVDYEPREVFTGHYVPVSPTPLNDVAYIAHSKTLFSELGLNDSLVTSTDFVRMFSGDTSMLPEPLSKVGWACGYALSIYGREYYQQCPFGTGNGYGDGRAISIFEGVLGGKRWEMQLKGAGRTPYCRGADGRAVLRSSIREFLAQEHMYALGVPTSRSLTLFVSKTQTVKRPWFNEASRSRDPEVMIDEAVAISTRVAPSFMRVGQLELFGRRARKNEHPKAMEELEQIVLHVIEREYSEVIAPDVPTVEKVLHLAQAFQNRLTSLVANWIRVGYCQGNFNSDNCAVGGFTIDYGPFGFIDVFDPMYQPWTGGGEHFSFFNQAQAAQQNFYSFCTAVQPLVKTDKEHLLGLQKIANAFSEMMQSKMQKMWALKLGLDNFDAALFYELETLMLKTSVDYTIFFRELSNIPEDISPLKKSFYTSIEHDKIMEEKWSQWLEKWKSCINTSNDTAHNASTAASKETLSEKMKRVNPKYTLREWFLVPAYKQASKGDYTLIRELQDIMTDPYAEQSKDIEEKYYTQKPSEFFEVAGISHITCSS